MSYDTTKLATLGHVKSLAERVANLNTALETRLDALEYVDIAIASFTASPTTFEVGVSTAVTLKWSVTGGSGDITITLNDTDVSSLTTTTATITAKTTYTLTATDGTTTATKSVTVNAYNYVYYGAAAVPDTYDKTFLTSLSSALSGSRSRTFTAAPGADEYIFYAVPTSLGTCTFTVGGFSGGFTLVDTISITNGAGASVSYYVYKSDNANLGSTSVTVS